MKRFQFQMDRDVESWMQCYTGSVLMPGHRRELRTDTRLFFDFYWQLLELGYTDVQIAEYAVQRKWCSDPPLHDDLAMAQAVYALARYKNLKPSKKLPLYIGKEHPRNLIDRLK